MSFEFDIIICFDRKKGKVTGIVLFPTIKPYGISWLQINTFIFLKSEVSARINLTTSNPTISNLEPNCVGKAKQVSFSNLGLLNGVGKSRQSLTAPVHTRTPSTRSDQDQGTDFASGLLSFLHSQSSSSCSFLSIHELVRFYVSLSLPLLFLFSFEAIK